MADFGDLGSWCLDQVHQAFQKCADNTTNSAKEFVVNVVEDTPVDTSKALSNWQVSIGSSISGSIEAYVLGKYGSSASASRGQTIALSNAKLSNRKLGETIYIINHCEYIESLNDGRSKQQPTPGYINRRIQELSTRLKGGI